MTTTSPGAGSRIRSIVRLSAFAVATSASIGAARAQQVNAGQGALPSQQVAAPTLAASNEPPLPTPEAVLVDPFGAKTWLNHHGIAVLFDDYNQFAGSISGGEGGPAPSNTQTTGGASLDGQVGLEIDIDWQRLAGLTGFSTHTSFISRYGGKPASVLIGDDLLSPSQEVYGAGGNVVVHLVDFYGEETLAGGRVDVTAGRIPLLNDFVSSPLYCNFEQGSLCGNPHSTIGNFAHSSYPDANWAFRVRVRPVRQYYVQSGIFFSEPGEFGDQYDRTGFEFNSNDISGEAFPVEAGWEPTFGKQALPGHYKVGFVYDNNHHTDDYFDTAGSAFEATGLPARMPTGSTMAYALADQMLVRNNPGPSAGLILLGGFVFNDPETSVVTDQYFVGIEDGSFWKARPYDGINALFSYQKVSKLVRSSQAIAIAEGLPNFETEDGASGLQDYTMVFELNYGIHVARGVYLVPDFQYLIRPNAQQNLPDAAFLGFNSHIELF